MGVETKHAPYNVKKAVAHGITGFTLLWGAGKAVEAARPYVAETFSNRPGLSQMWSGEAPWLTSNREHSSVEVFRDGRPMTTIPSRAFSGDLPTPVAPDVLRPTPRPLQIPPWVIGVGAAALGGVEVYGIYQAIQGARKRDSKRVAEGFGYMMIPTMLACGIGPEISQLTQEPPAIIFEYQAAEGAHPETARLTNVSFANLEQSLAGVDLARIPEAQPLLTALRDTALRSADVPITIVANGQTLQYGVPNGGRDLFSTFEHISDGKGFSIDLGLVQIPVQDPTGKEHYLLSYTDASGNVITQQAIWDKNEPSQVPGMNVGSLRIINLVPGESTAQATRVMSVVTFDSDPSQTFWLLRDPQNSRELTLEASQAAQVQAAPTFADTLIKLSNQPQVSAENIQPPLSNESLPNTISVTATAPAETPPTAPVEAPTEVPRLSIDVTKSYGEWDMTAFTAEQQAWISQAMTDPDHTPKEAKAFYDQLAIEGIWSLTGDRSISKETMGKYFEFLFANGIREVAPLPFAWRQANLESMENQVPFNWNGNRGYLIEGYEGLGHDPNYGTPEQLFSSVERHSTLSGLGENWSPKPTREKFALLTELRDRLGQNRTRDTIFGEPSFLIYARDIAVRGDLMALTDIAGTGPGVAQEAVIRMYDERSGAPRYTLVRVQYADETIQPGDLSCEQIPLDTSIICPPGTVVPRGVLSAWDDRGRATKTDASREKMLELFTYFTHPPLITLQGKPVAVSGTTSSIFMDGAMAAWDVKTPTVPPEFFK